MARGSGSGKFDPDLVARICERVSVGETLTKITEEPGMPTYRTFARWVLDSQTGRKKYLVGALPLHELYFQARQCQADWYADQIVDLSEVPLTGQKSDNALVQARRLKIDSLKWISSKLKPQSYGDKVVHAGDKDAPVTVNIVDYSKA